MCHRVAACSVLGDRAQGSGLRVPYFRGRKEQKHEEMKSAYSPRTARLYHNPTTFSNCEGSFSTSPTPTLNPKPYEGLRTVPRGPHVSSFLDLPGLRPV